MSGFFSTLVQSVSPARVSLLKSLVLSCREPWCIWRVLGVFPLTWCVHLGLAWHRCISRRLVTPLMGCLSKPCRRTDWRLWKYFNIPSIRNQRVKEHLGAESQNLYSGCIIYVQGNEGVWVRIKGNCPTVNPVPGDNLISLCGHCYHSSASPYFHISPWSTLGQTNKALTTPTSLSPIVRAPSLPPYSQKWCSHELPWGLGFLNL